MVDVDGNVRHVVISSIDKVLPRTEVETNDVLESANKDVPTKTESTSTPILSDGSSNTLYPKKDADEATKFLNGRLGAPKSGLDPAEIKALTTLIGFNIERGIRSFPDMMKALIAKIGNE